MMKGMFQRQECGRFDNCKCRPSKFTKYVDNALIMFITLAPLCALLVGLILTGCAQDRTPAVDNIEDSVIVDCNVDRFNVRCSNPFGGAR